MRCDRSLVSSPAFPPGVTGRWKTRRGTGAFTFFREWGVGMTRGAERPENPHHQGVLLVAGLAELAVSTLGSALGTVRGLLRRSDTAELVAGAEQDLIARGRLVLDQYAAAPPRGVYTSTGHGSAGIAHVAAKEFIAAIARDGHSYVLPHLPGNDVLKNCRGIAERLIEAPDD